MAQVLNNLFGGSKPAEKQVPAGDSDFADYVADAAEPSPASVPGQTNFAGTASTGVPYTKWYRIQDRHSLSEFRAEGLILAGILVMVVMHLIGARLNRNKARAWIRANSKALASEFAVVGFNNVPNLEELPDEKDMLKEKSLFEYATYATGRQNVAFLDAKLTLKKRFNPVGTAVEMVTGFVVESFASPTDFMIAKLYPFDGKESLTVPDMPGASEIRSKDSKSSFDNFVWALVNKDKMKQLREDRYDVSTTSTKDHAKLPTWLTIMTENAAITEALLTPELISAATAAGDLLEYVIVSDLPIDKPKVINDTVSRKRIFLKYRLPSNNNYESLVPIFQYFLRMPDQLVEAAHFRPEVQRKLKATRDATIKEIERLAETEKAEERASEREKARKQKRDAELAGLDAKAQKKYLEKEKEKEMRKAAKKQTTRG